MAHHLLLLKWHHYQKKNSLQPIRIKGLQLLNQERMKSRCRVNVFL